MLFISGYPADALGSTDKLESHWRLLGKPFTTQQLSRAVRDLLAASQRDSAASRD